MAAETPYQTTHWDGCWRSGRDHYECAVREVERWVAYLKTIQPLVPSPSAPPETRPSCDYGKHGPHAFVPADSVCVVCGKGAPAPPRESGKEKNDGR